MRQKIDFTSFRTIVFFAILIRIVAAIFSPGYGMHDDHFLIVEASASWVDGFDYNHWLPWSPGSRVFQRGIALRMLVLTFCFFQD